MSASQAQSSSTQHPQLLQQETPRSSRQTGSILKNAGMTLSFIRDGDQQRISIGRIDSNGHEITAFSTFIPNAKFSEIKTELERKGLRSGFAIGFDEACAILEDCAFRGNFRVTRNIPSLSYRQVSPADLDALSRLNIQAKNPTEQVDRLTGLPGKALLMSPQSLAELNLRIPDNKALAFLDFNNMGLANKEGLGREVDTILGGLDTAAQKTFGKIPYQLLRIGGDEFAIVLSNRAGNAQELIEKFRAEVGNLRERAFSTSTESLSKAEVRAERRAMMRKIISEYKNEQNIGDLVPGDIDQFSTPKFRSWVVNKLQVYTSEFLPAREQWTGELVCMLANERIKQAHADSSYPRGPRVMTFSVGAVEIGQCPTPTLISRALDLAEKQIHAQKEQAGTAQGWSQAPLRVAPQKEIETIVLRKAGADTLENLSITEAREASAREYLLRLEKDSRSVSDTVRLQAKVELRKAAAVDPSVGHDVLRHDFIKDVEVEALVVPGSPRWISAFVLDVNHFGVLNNQLGYTRADALIAKIAKSFRDELPGALIIRKAGGKLLVFTEYATDQPALDNIRQRAELALKECVNDRAMAEYMNRVAQEMWDTGERDARSSQFALKRVQISDAVFSSKPGFTFEDAVAEVEKSAQLVGRP